MSRFLSIKPGQQVSAREKVWEIVAILREDTIVARELVSKNIERLRIDELRVIQQDVLPPTEQRDFSDYSDEEWAIAKRRLSAVLKLLEIKHRTRSDAHRIAKETGCSVSTLYRWMDLYLESGTSSCLIGSKRGPSPGAKNIPTEVEAVLSNVIEDLYLSRKRQRPQSIIDEVVRLCRLNALKPPHPNTIRNRLAKLPPSVVYRRRALPGAGKFDAVRGPFPNAEFPLAVVQIDHTLADIVLVEDVTRLPMGRPWITLAVDVCTRMVVGVYVGLNAPSALSVGLCVSNAILPKAEYLLSLGLETDWPVYGRMRILHADNGKEFGGKMLTRTCDAYQIDLNWRPLKNPKFGGHIERLMGTVAVEFLKLPGATFSNVQQRRGTNPEKKAALTLREFERHLVEWITGVYHERIHSQLNTSPIRKWSQALYDEDHPSPLGPLEIPSNPAKLRIDFMPFMERSVQDYGIVIEGVHYFHEVLNSWIHAADPDHPRQRRKFVVRYDPRSMRIVHFLDPETQHYHEIPFRDPTRNDVSLWEIRSAQKRLKAEGRKHIDEQAIFDSIERSRQRVDEAIKKTAAARRAIQRRPGGFKPKPQNVLPMKPAPLSPMAPPTDGFVEGPIKPFSVLE